MKYVLLALFTIIDAGCGQMQTMEAMVATRWPEPLKKHVNSYIIEAAAHGKPVPDYILNTGFGEIRDLGTEGKNEKIVGYCSGTEAQWGVSIDTKFLRTATDEALEQLMYHELSHCIFKMEHRGKINVEGQPTSIMYPFVFSSTYYSLHRDEYLVELFLGGVKK